jgi:hypothetical protein
MVLTRKQSDPIHDAMGRYGWSLAMSIVHTIAHDPTTTGGTQILGDGSIAGHAPFGDPTHNGHHIREEIPFLHRIIDDDLLGHTSLVDREVRCSH